MFGPTVEHGIIGPCGRYQCAAVKFKHSGYRHAVRAKSQEEADRMMREYIGEAPYGRNRFGRAWELR